MLRKMSISRIGKYVHMVVNISAYINFSALRAVGGDVEIFRTKFLKAIVMKRSIFGE